MKSNKNKKNHAAKDEKTNKVSFKPVVMAASDLRSQIRALNGVDPTVRELLEQFGKLEQARRRAFLITNIDAKGVPLKDAPRDLCPDTPEQTLLKNKLRLLLGVGRGAGRTASYRGRSADVQITVTSGASAPVSTVTSLYPNNSTDAVTLAGVFDESRTTHLEVYVRFQCLTAANVPSGPVVPAPDAMVVYDPANAAAYGGVIGGLDADMRIGPCSLRAGTSPSYDGDGVKYEWHHRVWAIPTALVDPGLVTDLLGSNWVSAKDTAVLIGYLKPYITSMGAAGYGNMLVYPIFHMEWRVRG
jgi:hypothetical protein